MVEWKKLGDICDIIRGNGVQKKDFVESGVGCIHYGQIYTHYGSFTYKTNKFVPVEVFEKARKASKGDIIMTDTSENVEDICKSVAYLGDDDIAVSNHALILKHNQNPKFIAYSTLTDSFFVQKRKYVVGVKVSGIKPEDLAKIKIYLPSLSEQNRIVGILDTFTDAIENLKKQISLRKKQYSEYRDALLDLEGKEGVSMKTLGEIGTFIRGSGIQKSDFVEEGFDCIHYGQIHTKYGISAKETFSKITESLYNKSKKASFGDVILATTSEDAEGVAKPVVWLGENDVAISGDAYIYHHNQNGKYLAYVFSSHRFSLFKIKNATGTKVVRISGDSMAKFKFPLPSKLSQDLIVFILSKFEAIIANIEKQLTLREKQYEYYRNKLLTFD